MAPINGVDDRIPFFSININQENKASHSITEHSLEPSNADPSGSYPDFQTSFKTILDSLTGAGTDSPENGAESKAPNPLASISGSNNNISALMAVLEQMSQSGSSSSDLSQTGDQLLSQLLSASKQPESRNGAQPMLDIPTTQVISNYQQAMREFQKAFNLLPAGTTLNSRSPIVEGDSAVQNSSGAMGAPPLGAPYPGVNPTQAQVSSYITEQCRQMGIPEQLGLATAATESGMNQFNQDGTPLKNSNPDSTDWGLMQINDKAWGDVFDFNLIKSDWKYNIRAGLQILKNSFEAALRNNEGMKGKNDVVANLARAAYSGYNAGVGNMWRYRTSVDSAPKTGSYDVLNNEGYDLRDLRFWDNYQKLS